MGPRFRGLEREERKIGGHFCLFFFIFFMWDFRRGHLTFVALHREAEGAVQDRPKQSYWARRTNGIGSRQTGVKRFLQAACLHESAAGGSVQYLGDDRGVCS